MPAALLAQPLPSFLVCHCLLQASSSHSLLSVTHATAWVLCQNTSGYIVGLKPWAKSCSREELPPSMASRPSVTVPVLCTLLQQMSAQWPTLLTGPTRPRCSEIPGWAVQSSWNLSLLPPLWPTPSPSLTLVPKPPTLPGWRGSSSTLLRILSQGSVLPRSNLKCLRLLHLRSASVLACLSSTLSSISPGND